MPSSSARDAKVDGSRAREDLADAGLASGYPGDVVGGEAAGEHSSEHVQRHREAGTLPVADGEGAIGGFDGGGVAGDLAGEVVAAGDG